MLIRGNSKLGRRIMWQWSIPAGVTCPGKTTLCDKPRCYAQKGFYSMPNVNTALFRNYEMTRMSDFVQNMIDDIHKRKAPVVRIHVAGDFYDIAYIRKWHSIVNSCPDTRFFTYTRSWRLTDYREALTTFAKDCKNLRMWWSLDAETGFPKKLPPFINTCYMAIAPDDIPDPRTSLVFRDYPMRGVIQKRVNGVMVCPPENGVTNITCEQCGICWRNQFTPKLRKNSPDRKPRQRMSLQLVGT